MLSLSSSCCGAGTAADTEMTTQMISSELELHRLNTGRQLRVCTANRLLKQMLFRYKDFFTQILILDICKLLFYVLTFTSFDHLYVEARH